MKTKFPTLAMAALLVASLAACGEGGEPGNQASAAPPPAAAPAPPLSPEAEARAFLDSLYAPYVRGEMPNLDNFYTAERRDPATGFDERPDHDPVCQCQQLGQFSYAIQSVDLSGERARALVAISNLGERATVAVKLARENGEWRVAAAEPAPDRGG